MAGISPRSGLSLVPTASCYTYTIYINTRINRMQMFRCALEAAKIKKMGAEHTPSTKCHALLIKKNEQATQHFLDMANSM